MRRVGVGVGVISSVFLLFAGKDRSFLPLRGKIKRCDVEIILRENGYIYAK
jgi:hypothetical protein